MGTTSEKLTYLNTTKEKIRDSINLTGANIGTSDTFRSYATKLKLGLIDIINNGTDTLYSNFPKVSGIGSNLSLTPTYEAPMKLNEIQGDTFQQTYTGKNKFNLTRNNTTYNNVTTQYKGSEFILNGTTSSSANIISPDSNTLFSVGTFEAGTYAFTLITNSGYNANEHNSAFYLRKSDFTPVKSHGVYANDNFTSTFTLEEDSELFVQIYSNSGNVVFDDYHMYFQIELGSATDYEPYVGGTASPNPDYPQTIQSVTGLQNIEVCGKNLFDKQEIIDNEAYLNKFNASNLTTNSSGISWEATGNDSYISLPATITGGYGMLMKVNPNTSYTLSFDTNYELTNYIHYIKGDYTFISRNNSLGHNSNVSFTTPSNCRYIFIRFGVQNQTENTINITNIQIEKGLTATTFVAHQEQNFELNLENIELCKIGNYQDYIYKSNGDWYIHKEIEKTVLNGSEYWLTNTSNGRTFMLNMTYPNRVGKSNRFNYSNEVSLESKNVFYFGNQQINFVNPKVNNTLINTLEDWKLYLKEQYDNSIPVLVYHILSTPTDTQITNTELIEDLETLYTAKSQEGTTNISITSEDLEMILNISALRGDVE